MSEDISVLIERKPSTNEIIQDNAERPNGRRPRIEAPMKDELGRLVEIRTTESAHQLANHRLGITLMVATAAATMTRRSTAVATMMMMMVMIVMATR